MQSYVKSQTMSKLNKIIPYCFWREGRTTHTWHRTGGWTWWWRTRPWWRSRWSGRCPWLRLISSENYLFGNLQKIKWYKLPRQRVGWILTLSRGDEWGAVHQTLLYLPNSVAWIYIWIKQTQTGKIRAQKKLNLIAILKKEKFHTHK